MFALLYALSDPSPFGIFVLSDGKRRRRIDKLATVRYSRASYVPRLDLQTARASETSCVCDRSGTAKLDRTPRCVPEVVVRACARQYTSMLSPPNIGASISS